MAGELLDRLNRSESSGPSISHETRLGMMVITILVFAFGFLVYHKMDLHERKLTQASIASTAERQTTDPPLNETALLANSGEQHGVTDPLFSRSDLSDGSPFAGLSEVEDEPAHPAVFQDTESGTVTETTPQAEADSTVPDFALNEPLELFPTPEVSTLGSEDLAVAELGNRDSSPAEPENSSAPPGDTANDIAASEPAFTVDSGEALAIMPDERFLQTDPEDSVPMPEDALSFGPVEKSEVDGPAVLDSSVSFIESEPATDATAASQSNDEPTLLAMADPQEDSVFSGGFTPDNNTVSTGHAPVSDPAEQSSAFEAGGQSPFPEPQERAHKTAERNTPFGSHGFNAVSQPGGQSGKNSVRTAAGSGSDGKFSLAAFNYQNNSAEPAPDDGSAFDSVVVQEGDNYTKISKRVYGTVQYFSALAVFNQHRIREPKSMRPGMVVLTPPKDVLEKRYPQLFIDSQPKTVEPAEFLVLEDGSPAYRVGERETLSEVSERFLGRSSRWIEIYRLNQSVVKDPNKLKAGLILALPADAAEVSVVP